MKDLKTNELQHILIKCVTACETCASLCLQEDDVKMMERCIRTDRDCADICSLTAQFVARESEHLQDMLSLCITACKACYEECKKHEHDHCQQCAEKCKECYKACQQYAALSN